MAREQVTLKVSGLWTYEDPFSSVPEGSLSVAKNVVLDQKNIVSPRRGYSALPIYKAGVVEVPFSNGQTLFEFNGYTHYHRASGELYYFDGSLWNEYTGTFVKPSNANRSRSAVANKNAYFTSANGVQKVATLGGSIVDAGARPGYAPTATLVGSGSLFTATDEGVAYRIVWGYKDSNQNLILGAPSNRTVVVSTAVNQDVQLDFQIPSNVTTSWFYQIYRTKILSSATPLAVGDQMYLALEGNPTSGEISSGTVTIARENQPDDLLGLELYTNATSEGILQANYEPPQCVDMALFQGHMFFANTKQKTAITIQLLGTGTDGLQDGDKQLIGGLYFQAEVTGPINNAGRNGSSGNPYLYLLQTSSGSPSQDVEETAKNLIAVINAYHTTIDAYYYSEISAESIQLPGQIRLVEKDFNLAPSFTVSDNGANISWTPNIKTAQTATAETLPNRVYYSKFQKPEAVPIVNYFDVGPANTQILRILPLRTSLLIFTTKETYALTGTEPFRVDMLDNTARLIAEDSLVALNNTAMGLFDQGVCQVSESLQVLSRPIEGDLLTIRGQTGSYLNSLSFGVGYESDRKYILYIPTNAGATTLANGAYVYNVATSTWTYWDRSAKFGLVNSTDDRLYMLSENYVSKERKQYQEQDIADEQVAIELLRVFKGSYADEAALLAVYPNTVDPSEVTRRTGFFAFVTATNTVWEWDTGSNAWVDSSTFELVPALADTFYVSPTTLTTITVGDIYYESDVKFSKVITVDPDTITFQVQDVLDWSGGTWEVQKVIPTQIQYNPMFMGNPAMLKQFSEVTLITASSLETLSMGFKGITSSGFEYVDFPTQSTGGWGLFPWGDGPWGGEAQVLRYRTWVPRQKQRDSAIIISLEQDTIYNNFEISGLSVVYRVIGPKVIR